MIKKSKSLILILTLDAIIFLLCIVGIYHISEKSTLPYNVEQREDGLFISDSLTESSDVKIDDKLLEVSYYLVENVEEIECVLDGICINDTVRLSLQREGEVYQKEVRVDPFYTPQYLLIASFVCLSFFIMVCKSSFFVLHPNDKMMIKHNR